MTDRPPQLRTQMASVACPRCGRSLSVMWLSPFSPMLDYPRIISANESDHTGACGITFVYQVLAQIDGHVRRKESAPSNLLARLLVNRPRSWDEAEELARDLDEAKKGSLT